MMLQQRAKCFRAVHLKVVLLACWTTLLMFFWLGKWIGIFAGNVFTLFKNLPLKRRIRRHIEHISEARTGSCPRAAYYFVLTEFLSGHVKIVLLAFNIQMFVLKNVSCRRNSLSFLFMVGKLIPDLLFWAIHRNPQDSMHRIIWVIYRNAVVHGNR